MSQKISQFYRPVAASNGKLFLMYDPTEPDETRQDQLLSWNAVQALLTAGINIQIVNLSNSVNTLTNQVGAKLDASEVGSPNGAASLDASGFVPTAQLPFSLSSLVGTWDADTNTPTLADNTGIDKTAYLVSVDGTQNLGSGAITVVAGNVIIHLGGTWKAVNSAVTLGVTTINNSLTGNVDLDTSIVAETTDKNYVSDDVLAALAGTAGIPSGLNPFVTDSDPRLIGGGGGTVTDSFNTVSKYEVDGIVSGNGTTGAMTLTALGYNSPQAAIKFPLVFGEYGVIPVGSVTYDDAVIAQALLSSQRDGLPNLYFTGKQYNVTLTFADGFEIPKTLNGVTAQTGPLKFSVFGCGTVMRLRTGGAGKTFFQRSPINETESQSIVPYSILVDGFKFEGDNDPALTGIRLCSTKNSTVSNCIFRNMGVGLEMRFCLGATLLTNRFIACNQVCIRLQDGDWPGSTSSSSTTQALCLNQYLGISLAARGYEIINADSCTIIGGVTEGSVIAESAVYWQNTSTTVVKDLRIRGIHVEQPYSEAAFYIVAQDGGLISIGEIFEQNVDYMVSLNNISGTNRIYLYNCVKSGGFQLRNQGGAGGAFQAINVKLPGNPTTPAAFVDALNAVFDLSGSYIAPLQARCKIDPLTL